MNINKLLLVTLFFCMSVTTWCRQNTIYLDWFGDSLRNDKLFNLVGGGEEWQLLRNILRKHEYDITTYRYAADKDASKLYCGTHFDIPNNLDKLLKTYGKDKLAVFLWEPPSVKPQNFDRSRHKNIKLVFTWADDLIDNKKYFKFFYPQPHAVNVKKIAYEDKKFCCTMVGCKKSNHPEELYSERLKTILFFENKSPHLFDLYGPGWKGSKFSCYKGVAEEKFQTLARYKFCICYENIKNITGYVSEKIHHCLLTGCVPVYWGASNITDYIPAECFIDRRKFASNQELFEFLTTITPQRYQEYLDAAQKYLESPQQMLFSNLYFADCLLKGFIKNYTRSDFFDSTDIDLLEQIDHMQQKIIIKSRIVKSS
ncbi:MAG: glycosyltransferase family 10 [Candidatus Dependentiae bacterium]|nr:glycosyltransferase family 10 [Candidatus Dependentiae bacterium]